MARTATTRTHDLDAHRAPSVEKDLTNTYHVAWEYMSSIPLADIDVKKSLANQARFEARNEDTVKQYAEAVERGDSFPAIIVHQSSRARSPLKVIVDGNHRFAAYVLAGRSHIPAYVIDQKTAPQTIALMTFAFNTRHGMPTSEEERIRSGLFLVDNGASLKVAAAAVSIPERVLTKAVGQKNADDRAKDVGVDQRKWERLGRTVRNNLASISTDEGFKEAMNLAYDAGLTSAEVQEVRTQLNGLGRGGQKQKSAVRALATNEYHDRIQASAGGVLKTGGTQGKGPRARLGMAVGQIEALGDPSIIVRAYAAEERAEHAERVRSAAQKLTVIAEAFGG